MHLTAANRVLSVRNIPMDSSLTVRARGYLFQSQLFFHQTGKACPFSYSKKPKQISLLRGGSRQLFPFQIFADITHRFYSVGQNSTNHSIMENIKLRSSVERSQPALVKTVPVQVARELLNAGHRYLDVRTFEEFVAGHVNGAINVPYMHKKGTGRTKNMNFIEEVLLQFSKDDEIVVGCQSGKRSQMAAAELVAAGFTGVTDVAGGYSTWLQSGLVSRSNV